MGNNKNQLQLFAKALAAPCWLRPLALLHRPPPLGRAENVTKMLKPQERKENPNQQQQQQASLNRNHFFPAAVSSPSHVFPSFFYFLHASTFYAGQILCKNPNGNAAAKVGKSQTNG